MTQEIIAGDAPEQVLVEPPPEVRVPDDAERAAEVHLRQHRAAEEFPAQDVAPRRPPQQYAQQPAPVVSYQVPASQIASRTRALPSTPIKVIEELHARYPMSDGNRVRVIRREPKRDSFGNLATGWLGDLTNPLTMGEFTINYGGGKYALQVIGPTDAARGDFSERVITEMSLEIPGAPRMIVPSQLAESEDPMTQQRIGMLPSMEPERVAVKRIEVEADRAARLDDREREQRQEERDRMRAMIDASKPSDSSIDAIRDQATQTVQEMRRQHEATIDMMSRSIQAQERQLAEKENELKQLRTDVLMAKQEAVTAINNAETRLVTDLREQKRTELDLLREQNRKETEELRRRYDEDTRKSQADYAARLDADSRKYQAELAQMTQKSDRDRDQMEQRSERERQSLREDARLKEESLRSSYEDRIRQQAENNNARIQDLVLATAREIAAAKDQHALALGTIRETSDGKVTVMSTTSEMRIHNLENDLQTAKNRVEQLQRENDKMMAELHLPPAKALKQAEELSRMIGMVRPDEVEHPEVVAASDGKMDWGQLTMAIVKGFAEKAPEMLQKLSEVRQNNAAAVAPPGVVPRQLAGQAPVPPMAPAAMRRRRQGPPPAPGTMYGAPPPAMGPPAMTAPPRYIQPPPAVAGPAMTNTAEPPSVGAPGPTPQPQVPFGAPGYDPTAMTAQWDAASQSVAPPAPAPAAQPSIPPPAAPVATAAPSPPVNDMQIQMFVSSLEQAISQNVDPVQYAATLIEQIGPKMAVQAIGSVGPEQIVEMVSASPAGAASPIVTRSGEKYLQAVWEAAKSQLRAQGAQI